MQCSENELISENTIVFQIKRRLFELKKLFEQKAKSLKNAPEGYLRISKSNGVVQYYIRSVPRNRRGNYIHAENKKIVKQIAQKVYDEKVLQAAHKEIKILERILRQYEQLEENNSLAENIFQKLNPQRQSLIKPVRFPDNLFVAQWQKEAYESKGFSENSPVYYTSRGDKVRSKSEVIIAETLSRMDIPYRYEFPLQLNSEDGRCITIHPDFFCLNVKNRKEFIWEHFGMMEDSDYSINTVRKLQLYAQNGFFPGKNLIITTETVYQPISIKIIEKIAREFLLPALC